MEKKYFSTLIILFLSIVTSAIIIHAADENQDPTIKTTATTQNAFIRFLKSFDYTSRLRFQFDDNIFLTEDREDSDVKEIFTQILEYNHSSGDNFLRWSYTGDYDYYNEESLGVLSHSTNLLYSYRPVDKFSFGLGSNFYWLSDSRIASTLGDRLLALGYTQFSPYVEMKYEINPRTSVQTNIRYQKVDARDGNNDDYIDNKRVIATEQLNYSLTEDNNLISFFGYQYDDISFPQIFEKSATSNRPFVGLTRKFPGVVSLTYGVGFEQIYMDDNMDDDNVDQYLGLETIFSIYTKFKMSYSHNYKHPSLRREYTQYASNLYKMSLDHTINPKTSILWAYSYERQGFRSADALVGQLSESRKTDIQTIGTTLNRKLNSVLTLGLSYDYTKRDTEFANEGYTDNKVSIQLTAKY